MWEYKYEHIKSHCGEDVVEKKEVQKLLDKYVHEGWMLDATHLQHRFKAAHGGTDSWGSVFHLIFKRSIPESQ